MKSGYKLLSIIAVITFFASCGPKEENKRQVDKLGVESYFCGAEVLSDDGSMFMNNDVFFNGVSSRTEEEAFEGQYSVVLNKENQYGMTFILKELKPGDNFKVTVRRKSKDDTGGLAIQTIDNSIYEATNISYIEKDKNGWDLLSLNLQIPFTGIDVLKGIKIYAYNPEKQKVYFDNLKIEITEFQPLGTSPIKDGGINIILSDQDLQAIITNRDKAIARKVITNDLKKDFSGILVHNGKRINIKLRLKGDWTDHLLTNKWSYRITIEDDESFMGLKEFSIQAPETRDFVYEWLVHKIAFKEDLLSTRYEFLDVNINGINFGVYNLEEHFVKQLIESKKRREGPILKFDESGMWEEYKLIKQKGTEVQASAYFEASKILPFKAKKTFKKENLKSQYLIAQDMLYNLKEGKADISKTLDIERVAKIYALLDVFGIHHSFAWHNQRFYYNPIISRLELIMYDCYAGLKDHNRRAPKIYGNRTDGKPIYFVSYFNRQLFNDEIFVNHYLNSLELFSSKEYVENIEKEFYPEIYKIEEKLKLDYPYFYFDKSFYANNAKLIRKELVEYRSNLKKGVIKKFSLNPNKEMIFPLEDPFINVSLNAYLEEKLPGKVKLSLKNYHCEAIKVVGYNTKNQKDTMLKLPNPVLLDAYPNEQLKELTLKVKPKNLFFKVNLPNRDSIYKVDIVGWPRPTGEIPYEDVINQPLNQNSTIYSITDNKVVFNSGKHTLKENIIIPKNMQVEFNAGAELLLNNGKFILSYSPVNLKGTQKAPVKIYSTDGTGMGLTVLQAGGRSKVNHAIFDGLNTFNVKGWTLTGAVTFFESDVNITNSVFTNNKCEDGLNVVHSDFMYDNNEVSYTFSDGFDADFCTGKVVNSYFHHTGNDCIDFSTSQITIENCDIMYSGDKGISCGENSQITVKNVNIDGAVIGIASKDLSTVKVDGLYLYKCETGFGVYEKKPEFGPASIEVDNYILTNVNAVKYFDKGSVVKLNKAITKPKEAKSLEEMIQVIRSDSSWMNGLEEKANAQSVSINEVVNSDATWTLNKKK